MANDWLRAVRLNNELAEGVRRSNQIAAAAAAVSSARLAADAVDVNEIGRVELRTSSLYPQFLDAGIPPVEDRDDD